MLKFVGRRWSGVAVGRCLPRPTAAVDILERFDAAVNAMSLHASYLAIPHVKPTAFQRCETRHVYHFHDSPGQRLTGRVFARVNCNDADRVARYRHVERHGNV
jgi:hypothetical protein